MAESQNFNPEGLKTVSSVLWAWSDGDLTTEEAITILHLDDEEELLEAARGSEVPTPEENTKRHKALADQFVQAVGMRR